MAVRPEDRDFSRVDVRADSLTFNAYGPEGDKVASTEVALVKMIRAEDHHGLLLMAIFMQLVTLNNQVSRQREEVAQKASADPSEHMASAMDLALKSLKDAGMIPPGMLVESEES